ncbi:hypothetical protein CEXT_629641 [Caerostris extrusa]|uniref:Uncharacterized protein n=1 Tax=Caerostris extrusa TaxID=172846 RepID=A0AAV4VWU9_CAEEX|nr:hypothetical protein CEXT_629641 [Caerostris extrusa]
MKVKSDLSQCDTRTLVKRDRRPSALEPLFSSFLLGTGWWAPGAKGKIVAPLTKPVYRGSARDRHVEDV